MIRGINVRKLSDNDSATEGEHQYTVYTPSQWRPVEKIHSMYLSYIVLTNLDRFLLMIS